MPNRVTRYILKKFRKLINKNSKSRKQERLTSDMTIPSENDNSRVANLATNFVMSKQSIKSSHLDASASIANEETAKLVKEVKVEMEVTAPTRLLKINEEDILDKCYPNEAQSNEVYKQGEKERQE